MTMIVRFADEVSESGDRGGGALIRGGPIRGGNMKCRNADGRAGVLFPGFSR